MLRGHLILVDTSAFAQTGVNEAALDALEQIGERHRIATCLPVVLEVQFSARNKRDFERERGFFESFELLDITREVSEFALEIQWLLAKRGQHRMPIPDVMIAATAAVHDVPLLHYDHDFDLIAEVTGQPTQWIVPRGTGH